MIENVPDSSFTVRIASQNLKEITGYLLQSENFRKRNTFLKSYNIIVIMYGNCAFDFIS